MPVLRRRGLRDDEITNTLYSLNLDDSDVDGFEDDDDYERNNQNDNQEDASDSSETETESPDTDAEDQVNSARNLVRGRGRGRGRGRRGDRRSVNRNQFNNNVSWSPKSFQPNIVPFIEPAYLPSCKLSDPDKLNVHIVPHTHNDLGWLKTMDQYYYRSINDVHQVGGVQYILDSVVKGLWADENRRFIYSETAYFWKWWNEQTKKVKKMVQTLVQEGRLQFVGGAWSMNDEAATHYQSIIDQFTLGLRKLNDTFGECGTPHVGWQIDPFGHSREFASLVSAMGYDGLFLGRIDYQDKNNRLTKKNMEMIWKTNDDLGSSTDIFTGVLYNNYDPPPGFCFDILCDYQPIFDDVRLRVYNVDSWVTKLLAYIEKQRKHYRTNNIMLTMGGDFHYQAAQTWYTNLDKLIRYVNQKTDQDDLNINLFYSTPECYLRAVGDDNPTLPTKSDDFFPYASDQHSYWTGYFTSRPTTKYFEREANAYLQMYKQVQVTAHLPRSNMGVLEALKQAMGVMQHHDAITGTEKQHVTFDYERMLDKAVEDATIIPRLAINKLTKSGSSESASFSITRCRLNESSCHVSETSDKFIVTLYNPLGWKLEATPVRIPVVGDKYVVIAPNGQEIDSQILPISEHVQSILTRESIATHELVFIAINVKPFGYKSFYVQKTNKARKKRETKNNRKENLNPNNINEYIENIKRTDTQMKNIYEETKHIQRNIPNYRDFIDKSKIFYNPRDKVGVLADKNGEDYSFETKDDFAYDFKLPVNKPKVPDAFDLNEMGNKMLSEHPDTSIHSNDDKLDDMLLDNNRIKLKINNETGKISNYIIITNGKEYPLSIELLYYPGSYGNNTKTEFQSSGAYIFRPLSNEAIKMNMNFSSTVIKGKVVDEIAYKFTDYATGSVRIYKHSNLNYIEHDWVIGPIPIEDAVGKEFIVRYGSHIKNDGEFYTDSNGRQDLKRRLNYRQQWDLKIFEPIAGNYYPVTNKIFIQDSGSRLTVLTDRSEGGSSLHEGNIELMLHRRLLHDDGFGVGEALNETQNGQGLIVKGRHRLILSSMNDKNKIIDDKKKTFEMHLQPIVMLSEASQINLDKWLELKNCEGAIKDILPLGLHLLTLEPWNNNQMLLRFENYLEKTDKTESTDLEIDLNKLFNIIRIVNIRETALAANLWLDSFANKNFVLIIKAKEIKTFVADYVFY